MMKNKKWTKVKYKYKNLSIAKKAALWSLFAGIIQKGINVLFTPIFTRILTTGEFAQYTLYQSWHDIFIIFTSLYVYNYATYTAMAKYENDRYGFIASAQTLVSILTVIGFLIYCIVYNVWGDIIGFSLPVVILMFLDMLSVSAFNLWAAKERYNFHYKMLTLLSIIMGIVGPIMGILFTEYVNNRGFGRIYGVAVTNIVIGGIIYVVNFLNVRKWKIKEYWHYIAAFCVPLIPHFLSAQILTRFDRIMIRTMCGESQTGIYSLAYSVAMLMSLINDAILKSFTPWTYQALEVKNYKKIKGATTKVILIVAIANIILILFAPEAIRIFATEEYMEAIYIIPSVSASVYFIFLYNIFANIEYYYEETKPMAFASILAALVNVVLNYLFIPMFGFVAAGYTTLVSYILYSIGHFYFMKRVSKKYTDGRKLFAEREILIISVSFVVVSLGLMFLYKYILFRYVIIIMVVMLIKQIIRFRYN